MTIRKGISAPANPTTNAPAIVGRPVQTFRPAIIATPNQPAVQTHGRIVARPDLSEPQQHPQHVRGMLVDGAGRPMRGLSQTTMDAHKAFAEDATERCMNCGRMVPPKYMKTVVANAYNSNNPLRLCDAPPAPGEPPSCVQLAYKDPHKVEARQMEPWKPSVPRMRFDRETAAPYDAHARGVTLKELTTRDTYHNEREVPAHLRPDVLVGEGTWSGGGKTGHVVTRESVSASRDRASRRR